MATLNQRWQGAVAARSDAPFLSFAGASDQVTDWTYAEFDELVGEVAGLLAEHEVGPGRPLHLALANSPAFVAAWLAASRLGAMLVPSDPRASDRELREHIERTGPALGICSTGNQEEYREAASAGPAVISIDEDDVELGDLRRPGLEGAAEVEPTVPAAVLFTSGTTSAPKGVVVTQANYAFAGDVMAAAAALGPLSRQLVVLPLFHANAQYYSFAAAISAGASIALMPSFSASRFLDQAAAHRATHASLFAAPIRMILARGATPVNGLALRHVWFAQNLSDDQYLEIADLFGCRPRQLYGMTETIPAVLTSRALAPSPTSMGEPTLGCEVDLRAPDSSRPVGPGEVGEIVVRGVRGATIFAGYLDDPETTAESFEGDWFRTGDLARRDELQRFRFAGRRGDVLKVAGENVSTVEVEAVLARREDILEAAVVGETDPIRDEVPVAYVVRSPRDAGLSAADLSSYCESELAPAKRPRRFYFVEELPRTSVGKIKKFQLRPPAEAGASR